MKRQDIHHPHDYFNLLPTEEVLASDVIQGDLVKCYNSWGFVMSNERDDDNFNNGYNQKCLTMMGGGFYRKPDDTVIIIQRSLLNKEKIKEFVARHQAEEAERQHWRDEEEREEKESLRDMRDQLNRELGED